MLPGQMSLRQLESVLNISRSLPSKFCQIRQVKAEIFPQGCPIWAKSCQLILPKKYIVENIIIKPCTNFQLFSQPSFIATMAPIVLNWFSCVVPPPSVEHLNTFSWVVSPPKYENHLLQSLCAVSIHLLLGEPIHTDTCPQFNHQSGSNCISECGTPSSAYLFNFPAAAFILTSLSSSTSQWLPQRNSISM